MSVCVMCTCTVYILETMGWRERERQRETERDRRERQRERQRETERKTERERQRERPRDIEKDRERQRERDRERHRLHVCDIKKNEILHEPSDTCRPTCIILCILILTSKGIMVSYIPLWIHLLNTLLSG